MKKQKTISIKVYFQADDVAHMKVYKRLELLTKRTSLSASAVAGMALRFGLPRVEDALLEPVQLAEVKKSLR